MEIIEIFSIISTILTLVLSSVLGILAYKLSKKQDDKSDDSQIRREAAADATQWTELRVEFKYMNENIVTVKNDVKNILDDNKDIREKLAAVDGKANAANTRVDALIPIVEKMSDRISKLEANNAKG